MDSPAQAYDSSPADTAPARAKRADAAGRAAGGWPGQWLRDIEQRCAIAGGPGLFPGGWGGAFPLPLPVCSSALYPRPPLLCPFREVRGSLPGPHLLPSAVSIWIWDGVLDIISAASCLLCLSVLASDTVSWTIHSFARPFFFPLGD